MLQFASAAAVISVTLMLTGCDDNPSGNVANAADPIISIERAGNESGNLSVNLPGFDAKVRIPGAIMTSGKFDIDGVTLFPGSKVSNLQIGSGETPLRMTFEAPAEPAKVVTWFQERFAEKSVKVAAAGATLTGITNDGEKFSIGLAPGGDGNSVGTISIGSSKTE